MTRAAMQRRIKGHRSVVDIYATELAARGVAGARELDILRAGALAALSAADPTPLPAAKNPGARQDDGPIRPIRTAVPTEELRSIASHITTVPPDFDVHAGIQALLDDWRQSVEEDRPVDWHLAENIAYGSLLANGFNVRLTGLDVGR